MTAYRFLLVINLTLVLGACAIKPKQSLVENNQQQQLNQMNQWTIKGRIAIRTPEQSNSLSFNWQHTAQQQQLVLFGTFGTTYATLLQTSNMATLELSDEKIFRSDNVEQLLLDVLGYPLPVEHLKYWVKGLPYPDEEGELTYDSLGYLKTIHYRQWKITFKKYKRQKDFNNLALPGMIKVSDGKITLNLALRNWRQGTEL